VDDGNAGVFFNYFEAVTHDFDPIPVKVIGPFLFYQYKSPLFYFSLFPVYLPIYIKKISYGGRDLRVHPRQPGVL
jgi:hypothetical protein